MKRYRSEWWYTQRRVRQCRNCNWGIVLTDELYCVAKQNYADIYSLGKCRFYRRKWYKFWRPK